MKRFICIALTLAMLISILPVSVSAEVYASTIYLKPNEITLMTADSTPDSYFYLTYHSNNGTNSIAMTKNSSEYFSAVVNSNVTTLEFNLMSADGSMLWSAMCEYQESNMNCASFSDDPQLVKWCDYLTQILSDGNVLYFTPNEDWLMTSNRFSVCFSGANNQNTYVEMTAVGDGSYAVLNRSDATRYVFCTLRATATSPDQTTLRSVTVSKPSSQFNHYTLDSGMSGGASGEWSFKETPGGGSEEIPPEIILPDENAQVSWGYSENRIEGYTMLREALALYAGETIYIKLIKELSLEETITIVDGKYQIDLSGFNITSSAEEPFVLQYADVKIVNSEGNTGVTATANTDKYMFRVENSVFEIAGGYFETQGAGIIRELTSASNITISGGFLHSGSESVILVADGKLTVKGGNLLGFPSFAHILYTGSDYNNNINISNIESNESTIYVLENLSILPDDLGVKDRVIVSLVPGGNAENIISSGQVYYIDFNCFLTFQELDLVVKVRNGEEYTMPDCTLVPELGSVFECWKDVSDNMLYQVGQVIIPQRDMHFLASWKPSEIISVSFDANGGSGNMDALPSTSSAPFILPDCVFTPPYGKVFDVWQIGEDLYSAGQTVTLYTDTQVNAIWKDGVAITYKANGGIGDDIVIFADSEKNITLPENTFTAPANKTFKAWQINGKEYPVGKQIKITEPTEIYAVWNEGYKVTYLPNGGTGKTITEKYTEATHILLAENTFTHPEGISFKCWEIDGEEYLPGQEYFVDKNTDILAKWYTAYTIKYVYTYIASDGTKLTKTYEDMALDGIKYTFRLPGDIFNNIYSNHEPEYWEEESGGIYQFGENNYIDRDITVELVYKEFYKIQIDPRNDIDSTEQYTKYKGDEFVFPDAPQNIPEGYAFDGWQSVLDGERYYPSDTMTVEKHIGFYAVWVKFIELSKIESIFKDGGRKCLN